MRKRAARGSNVELAGGGPHGIVRFEQRSIDRDDRALSLREVEHLAGSMLRRLFRGAQELLGRHLPSLLLFVV
jgi:hypothetical protein